MAQSNDIQREQLEVLMKVSEQGMVTIETHYPSLSYPPSVTSSSSLTNLFPSQSQKWKPILNSHEQKGWNCFDVAVGMERQALVKYALDNAENLEVRQLLAPEIRHAAGITAVYMARKKEISGQEKKIEEERIGRIIELFQIAEALKGENEQAFIEAQADQLLTANDDSSEKQELRQLVSYTLPKTMHTEILCKLVNDYYDAHEFMKKAVAECNEALGYGEGKRLSLEELDKLFFEPMNREKYQQAYEKFAQSRAQIFVPAEQRFKDYCESEEAYKAYVQGYYGANQWFAFQRHFAERNETSMVDIAARYLKVQIFIHSNQSDQKIIYHTQAYGIQEIHIEYNGINHFMRLETVNPCDAPLEVKDKPENFKKPEGLLWLWDQSSSSKLETQDEEEVSLKKLLIEAYDNKQYAEQCFILAKLADYHLQQKNYPATAKLLNGALAIVREHVGEVSNAAILEETLLNQLKVIEPTFVREKLQIDYKALPENHGINPHHKKQLLLLREAVKKQLADFGEFSSLSDEETSNKIQQLFKWITQEINILLHEIVQDCITLMPTKPPCDYALIGTGSLAREEITPYSDLECFILIAEDKPEYKEYFRHLAQLLELKIINLGETDLIKGQELLPLRMLNPVKKGFSLDVHKTPNNNKYSMIGTPQQIAQYQSPRHYVNETLNHLSGALLNVILITGTENKCQHLLANYKQGVNKIFAEVDLITNKPLSLIRSLKLLEEDKDRFMPNLASKNQGKIIQVKEDLYRLPHTVMDALALYMGLESSTTWDRINELCIKGFMLTDSGNHLKRAFSTAVLWRLKAYDYYNHQQEFVNVLLNDDILNVGNSEYYFNKGDFKDLLEYYRILIPLYKYAEVFCQSKGEENRFPYSLLYDDSAYLNGMIAARLCQYEKALHYFSEDLKELENGNDLPIAKLDMLYSLGEIFKDLGDNKKALKCFDIALEIAYVNQDQVGKFEIARILNVLGATWQHLEDYEKSDVYLKQALDILTKFKGSNRMGVAAIYNNLGFVWLERKNATNDAVKCFEQAVEIVIKIKGIECAEVASGYNNLGLAFSSINNLTKAKECYKKAIEINTKLYGDKCSVNVKTLRNLGALYRVSGDTQNEVIYLEQALSIIATKYGQEHLQTLPCLKELGLAYCSMKDAKGIECFQKSLKIMNKNFDCFERAQILYYLGSALHNSGKIREGLDKCQEALKLIEGINDVKYCDLKVSILCRLGGGARELNEPQNAIKHYEQARLINSKVYGSNHPNVAQDLNSLGEILQDLKENSKAIEYHEQALEIYTKKYGMEHPTVAESLNSLGTAYRESGKVKEAVECHEKALKIDTKVYGPKHEKVAVGLACLGSACKALGEINKARENFEKAYEIAKISLGENHSTTQLIFEKLSQTHTPRIS